MTRRSAMNCLMAVAGPALLIVGCQPSTSDHAAQDEAKATAAAAAQEIAQSTDQAKSYGTVQYDTMIKAPVAAPLQITEMPHSISAEAAAAKFVNPAELTAREHANTPGEASAAGSPDAKP